MFRTLGLVLWMGPGAGGATPGWVEATIAAAEAGDAEAALRAAQAQGRPGGSLPGALKWAAVALERGAHPLRVNLIRGDAFLAAEAYAEAAREYFEVVAAAPESGYAHVRLWLALRDAHLPPSMDGQRLRGVLRKAGYFIPDAPRRPRRPTSAQTLEEAGYAHVRAARFEAAIDAFEASVVQDDSRPGPFRGLGIAHGRLERRKRALAAYRLFLEMTRGDTRERRQVRRILNDAERRRGLNAAR